MRFKLILATIHSERREKPEKCPLCGSRLIQHWEHLVRKVRDTQIDQVEVDRWHCRVCHHKFRTEPEGITNTIITRRLYSVGIALYMLGLSYRGVEDFLTAMGFPISYASVYLAVQKAAEQLKGLSGNR